MPLQVPMTGCKQCLEWQARRCAAGWTDGRTPGCGSLGQQVRPPLCQGQRGLALLAARAPPHPVSPTPLCHESPQGRRGGAPGWRHCGAPTASQKHHLPPPTPARSLAFSSETCDLPTTRGRWACPGPAGAHRSLTAVPGSMGCWRDWQEGPGGRAEAGGTSPGFPGTSFPLLPLQHTAHSRTHSCTHVHRHTHTSTHPHIQLHAHAR